jgi:hypothetical protein
MILFNKLSNFFLNNLNIEKNIYYTGKYLLPRIILMILILLFSFIISINSENCECELHRKLYRCGTLLHSWEGINILCANNDWHFYHTYNKNISNNCVEWVGTWYHGKIIYENGKIISDNLSPDGCYYDDIGLLCNTSDPRCYSNTTKNITTQVNKGCTPITTTDQTDNYWKYFSIICKNDKWIIDSKNLKDDHSKRDTTINQKSSSWGIMEAFMVSIFAL